MGLACVYVCRHVPRILSLAVCIAIAHRHHDAPHHKLDFCVCSRSSMQLGVVFMSECQIEGRSCLLAGGCRQSEQCATSCRLRCGLITFWCNASRGDIMVSKGLAFLSPLPKLRQGRKRQKDGFVHLRRLSAHAADPAQALGLWNSLQCSSYAFSTDTCSAGQSSYAAPCRQRLSVDTVGRVFGVQSPDCTKGHTYRHLHHAGSPCWSPGPCCISFRLSRSSGRKKG